MSLSLQEPKNDQLYARFIEIGFNSYMSEETKRLGETFSKSDKSKTSPNSASKTAVSNDILGEFTTSLLKIATKLLEDFYYQNVHFD